MERRKGQPRTEEEREITHRELYGTERLPPRGAGLERHSSNPKGKKTIDFWERPENQNMEFYEEDEETGKLIPFDPETIPSYMEVEIANSFEKYFDMYGEEAEGVVVKDRRRNINIVATRKFPTAGHSSNPTGSETIETEAKNIYTYLKKMEPGIKSEDIWGKAYEMAKLHYPLKESTDIAEQVYKLWTKGGSNPKEGETTDNPEISATSLAKFYKHLTPGQKLMLADYKREREETWSTASEKAYYDFIRGIISVRKLIEKSAPVDAMTYRDMLGEHSSNPKGGETMEIGTLPAAIKEGRAALKAEAEKTGSISPETLRKIADKHQVPYDRLVRETVKDLKVVKLDATARVSFSPDLVVELANPETWIEASGGSPEVFGVVLAPEEIATGMGEPLERCIMHTKRTPGIISPYAICRASLRRERGLPVRADYPTEKAYRIALERKRKKLGVDRMH